MSSISPKVQNQIAMLQQIQQQMQTVLSQKTQFDMAVREAKRAMEELKEIPDDGKVYMNIGTVMMLNVWFVLWPNQKKVLGLRPALVEERLRCSRITHLSSRTNTMLSIPLLFFMAAGSHGGFLLG